MEILHTTVKITQIMKFQQQQIFDRETQITHTVQVIGLSSF